MQDIEIMENSYKIRKKSQPLEKKAVASLQYLDSGLIMP